MPNTTTTARTTVSADLTLMQRVALTRLHRFDRIVAIAEQSESPLWQSLARRAAHSAYRDCLLTGLDEVPREQAPARAA